MTLEQFYALEPQLRTQTLGGIDAQFKLAPAYREKYDLAFIKTKQPKLAGVLIIFFPDAFSKMRFILTKRPEYGGHHSNQISFTGGKHIASDTSLLQTAIRETQEEIGLHISANQVLKKMTEVYIPPSNFLVQPYITFISETPTFTPNYEVEKLITPTLSELMNPSIIQTKKVVGANGISWISPGFVLEDEFVWGATAMMLNELKDLIEKCNKLSL